MANMAHCRFTNTLADLQDCYDHMDTEERSPGTLSPAEKASREKLIKLCRRIAEDYEE